MARPLSTRARAALLALACLILPFTAAAQTLTPSPFQLFLDNSGKIVNGGCVWTYLAGTTTAATTYTDAGLVTPNPNPILADSAGRYVAYLSNGVAYKFVYESTPCSSLSHGSTLKTVDNILAVPPSGVAVDVIGTAGETINAGAVVYLSDGSGSKVAGQWYNASATNAYSSSTALEIGFATAAVSANGSGSFRVNGRVTGLSLSVGSKYYVATAAGTVTTTAPANARAVGAADSATSLIVAANPTPWNVNLMFDGTNLTSARDLIFSGNNILRRNTADAADTGQLFVAGGGDAAQTRGGYVVVHGNEASGPGQVELITGNVANSAVSIVGNSGSAVVSVDGATGLMTLANGQVKFPATQNPSSDVNTLDDYEEGTWTPVIGGSGGTSGQTYGTQAGTYVKIGRMVTVQFVCILTVKGTITSAVQLQGLPFALGSSGADASQIPTGAVRWANLASSFVNVTVQGNAGATTAAINGQAAAAAANTSPLATSDINNNSEFRGTLTYFAAN